jgi:hypothetical protein
VQICYEHVESLSHSLNRPLPVSVLLGQWLYAIATDKLTTTMQVAKRIYLLAQEENSAALMIGAYRALASTHYYLGDFESSRQYAMHGIEIWLSEGVRSPVEEVTASAAPVACLVFGALSEWHLGEIASCKATMAKAISLAKELNDMHSLGHALYHAAILANLEGNPAEVERLASDTIDLSARQNFALWLAGGEVLRGWARSACCATAEGLAWIEGGIEDWMATGAILWVSYFLALKAEALYLADRISEALEAINEAGAIAERFDHGYCSAELHRLRAVFLAALDAEESQIEASFYEATRIAKEQKSVSLEKRAEATYAEYRRQKASGLGGHGFRLPLC